MLALILAAVLAQPADIVLVRESAEVAGCERVGEVKASSWLGGAMTNVAYSRALNSLKKKAAAQGATHLQMLDSSGGAMGTNMLGAAYRCPQKSSPS